MENFLATVILRPTDTVGYSGAVTPKSFLCPPNFVVLRKICFKHTIKIKERMAHQDYVRDFSDNKSHFQESFHNCKYAHIRITTISFKK